MLRSILLCLSCLWHLAAGAAPDPLAAAVETMPSYQPQRQVTGVIRLWGHGSNKTDFMRRLVTRWQEEFAKLQPQVTFDYRMYGTASAIGALYSGSGDLALMGEEIWPYAADAYQKVKGYPVASVEIATGSLDVRNFDYAQMFFVHRDNPLAQMSLTQIDAIFGTEHRRGAAKNFRVWGDLGLTGEWAEKPIHLYGWSFDNDFWDYLKDAVFGGSHRFNNALHEYRHINRQDGSIYDNGQQALQALAQDPFGIAIANVRYANPEVKALALGVTDAGPFYQASKETLVNRLYPVTRIIPAAFNWPPGQPIDPAVKEFLLYILSREGQQAILEDGEYLPLNPAALLQQRKKLEQPPYYIRLWGDDKLAGRIAAWEAGFGRQHPEVVFQTSLKGSGTGIAGIYTGKADIALLDRAIKPVENMAFTWVHRHPPTGKEIAAGSPLAIVANSGNPIERITLAQLDQIFGVELRAGGKAVARDWRDLGVGSGTIHAYGHDVEDETSVFFRERVLKGSFKWNWDALSEFKDDADRRVADAVARDALGIGVTDPRFAGKRVKLLAVAESADAPFLRPGEPDYPLAGRVMAYFNQEPGKSLEPLLGEFLAYIASYSAPK